MVLFDCGVFVIGVQARGDPSVMILVRNRPGVAFGPRVLICRSKIKLTWSRGKDGHAATRIARGLTDRGIAVLRFDFTGPGESAGESAAATTFSSSIEDPPPISSGRVG